MNLNLVTLDDLKVKNDSIFSNQNRIRKAWVAAANGTHLHFVLSSYPKKERFELYKDIDFNLQMIYTHALKSYKENLIPSDLTILGTRVLEKFDQINIDHFLIDCIEIALAPYASLKEYSETLK